MKNPNVEIEDKKNVVLTFEVYDPNTFQDFQYKVIVGWVDEDDSHERIVVERATREGFDTIIDQSLVNPRFTHDSA